MVGGWWPVAGKMAVLGLFPADADHRLPATDYLIYVVHDLFFGVGWNVIFVVFYKKLYLCNQIEKG